MASAKITVTIPEEQLRAIRGLVDAGQAATVSGFVQHAIAIALDDVAGWQRMLSEALEATGGAMTQKERRWADSVVSRRKTSA